MRRNALGACACLLAARLLAACANGDVEGEEPMPKGDAPPPRDAEADASELWDDAGTKGDLDGGVTKGNPDASAPADASLDAPRADGAVGEPCAAREDGAYCAGLVGLPSSGLLRCVGRRSTGTTPCPGGCLDRPGGTDACLDDAVDPCFNERDGLYCGRTIGSATRPNDAFRCMYRRTTWSGPCAGGCAMGAGGVQCAQ